MKLTSTSSARFVLMGIFILVCIPFITYADEIVAPPMYSGSNQNVVNQASSPVPSSGQSGTGSNTQSSGQSGAGSNTQPSGQSGAGSNTAPTKTFTLSNPLKVDSVGGLVQNFVEIFSYIVVLFAVLALIYVGLQFILARGNSAKMSELKGWLFWIVIGVAVVIGARIIIQVVINTLQSTGTVDQRTIQSAQNALKRP